MIEVVGAGVRLRSLVLDDVDRFVAAGPDDPASSEADSNRARLREQVERGPKLDGDGYLNLAVEVAGDVIGDVQARAPAYAFLPGVCEIGIVLFADTRGRGHGTEAVRLFTRYLFDHGWERVQTSTPVGNLAMCRVLQRCGFGYEGILRSYGPAEYGSGREDYAMYAAVRGDWSG